MTMTLRFAIAAAAVAAATLAGCNSSDTIEARNESAESVAQKVAKSDIRPNPGKWESKMTLEKIEMPGMPAEMQGMMKQQLGKVTTSTSCLTPDEANRPDAKFFQPGDASGCTYKTFNMGGGKIDAEMVCEEGGMQQNMKMNGTYSGDAYTMHVSSEGKLEGQTMAMAMTIESRRVSECDE